MTTVMNKVRAIKGHAPFVMIPDHLIDIDPNVRTEYKAESIAELAQNIDDDGLMYPPSFQIKDGRYKLKIGGRRYRALKYNGCTMIPGFVGEKTEEQWKRLQLIENIQREDLPPKDIAAGVHDLFKETGSRQEVCRILKKSGSWVSKRLSLALGVGPMTTELLDTIKDMEVLYLFAKLEKVEPVKARMLMPEVKEGTAGREEIKIAMIEESDTKDNATGDLFGGEMAASDTAERSVVVSDQPKADPLMLLQIAMVALGTIADSKVGSPQAVAMKKTALAAIAQIQAASV